jgi:hypothetical protein
MTRMTRMTRIPEGELPTPQLSFIRVIRVIRGFNRMVPSRETFSILPMAREVPFQSGAT